MQRTSNYIIVGVLLFCALGAGLFLFKNKVHAPSTEEVSLIDYENTKIGDNSSIIALLNQLGGYANIALKTSEKPHTLTINYFDEEKGENVGLSFSTEHERNEIFLKRASTLFILIPNLDKIRMTYSGDSVFSVSKKYLEDLLEITFTDYQNSYENWEGVLAEKLTDKEIEKELESTITHFPEGIMSQEL